MVPSPPSEGDARTRQRKPAGFFFALSLSGVGRDADGRAQKRFGRIGTPLRLFSELADPGFARLFATDGVTRWWRAKGSE
jgi:hypothetical protein